MQDKRRQQWLQASGSGGNECREQVVAIMNGRALAEINAGSSVGGNDVEPGGGDIE